MSHQLHPCKRWDKIRYYTRRIMGFHERPMDALSVTGKDISFQNGLYVHVWNGMSLGRSKPCLFCRSGTALNCQSGTILNCHSETILNCHSRTAIEAFKTFKAVQNLAFFAILKQPKIANLHPQFPSDLNDLPFLSLLRPHPFWLSLLSLNHCLLYMFVFSFLLSHYHFCQMKDRVVSENLHQ